MNAALLRVLSLARERTLATVLDLPDEFMALQPAGARNHPAWTLGHLAFIESHALEALGSGSALDRSWAAPFAPGTQPAAARSGYPPKQELLERLGAVRIELLSQLETMDPGALDHGCMKPPSPLLGACATPGDVLVYLAWHEGYHTGQLAVWRRVAGLGR